MFVVGYGVDFGNQMGGSNIGNNGFYDKFGDYFGKKEFNYESFQFLIMFGGFNIFFIKEQ